MAKRIWFILLNESNTRPSRLHYNNSVYHCATMASTIIRILKRQNVKNNLTYSHIFLLPLKIFEVDLKNIKNNQKLRTKISITLYNNRTFSMAMNSKTQDYICKVFQKDSSAQLDQMVPMQDKHMKSNHSVCGPRITNITM